MHTAKGQVTELILEEGVRYLRVACPPALVPSPGQYLLAGDGSDAPLPVPLFHTEFAPRGFIAAASAPAWWTPGVELYLRGPLGRPFALPPAARKVGLIALDGSPARLKGLIDRSLNQEAAVVLVCDSSPGSLPDDVEVQPLRAMHEILEWADYLALDVSRENLPRLGELTDSSGRLKAVRNVQVLVRTPVMCGGLAECGACAVGWSSAWKLACRDGPVFDFGELASKLS